MAANASVLCTLLEEYHKRLTQHLIQMEQECKVLEQRWQNFSTVYQGNAAEQLRAGWQRTTDRFREYMYEGQSIARVLEQRINSLREFDRPEGLIP
jgi:hypothetical protein